MKNPSEMNNERLTHWMNKTSNSLNTEANRYNRRQAICVDLVDRYEELMEEMKERKLWDSWCESKGFCPTHDGWDCLA